MLAPELLSDGGIQRQNRLIVRALDELLQDMGGHLVVLALNDQVPQSLPSELAGLRSTTLNYFGANRWRYLIALAQASAGAKLVLYGLLGFTLMSLAQIAVSPFARRLLWLYGIEAWSVRSPWHWLAVRTMHGYLAISGYTLDKFRAAYGRRPAPWDRIIPNVVSPTFLAGSMTGSRPASPGQTLLVVSRMETVEGYKGIDTVIQALPVLVTKVPNLQFEIIGDGSDRPRLEAMARSLGVAPHVRFLGRVSDEELCAAYQRCDIYVMPSGAEGFGFVFIEAMAYGKPVVAARAAATPEVVRDDKTGILVEYGNVPQLVDALAKLLTDPDCRKRMGAAGLAAVNAQYSYPSLKQNLATVLSDAVSPSPAFR